MRPVLPALWENGGFPCILPYSGAGWDSVPEILLLGFLCVSLVPLRVQITGEEEESGPLDEKESC